MQVRDVDADANADADADADVMPFGGYRIGDRGGSFGYYI